MTKSNTAHPAELARTLVSRTNPHALVACLTGLLATTTAGGCVLSAVGDADEVEGGSSGSEGGDAAGSDESGGESGNVDGDGTDNQQCAEIQSEALAVLEQHCAGCHDASSNTASFGFVTDRDQLILSGMVVPGSAPDSPMFARIANGSMPPATAPSQPDADGIKAVGDWIDGCIDDVPPPCADGQAWISTQAMIGTMLADIATISSFDRPFTRYLTLTHLHNAGMCEAQLDRFRFGLSKTLNSLSLDSIITRPLAIDEWNTIYRIDLRDYDWEAAQGIDKWELLVDNNPYAFRRTDDDSEVLQDFTGTEVPFMAADWLVHDATEPPLYYDMLDIPSTQQQLENDLNINVSNNIANGDVARAGFLISGVSQNNRLYEHHPLSTGAFWLSYDFESNEDLQSLFAAPLGFQENGGEIIYSLPNGMQAYVIVNANGLRLDEAPIDIVTDPQQPDRLVRAGISCMSCHDAGLKFKADELRSHVVGNLDFSDAEQELIEQLHPTDDVMQSLIDEGSQRFASAVAQTWDGPAGSDEPIIEVFANFEDKVDLTRAAAEFGVEPDALLAQLGQLDPGYGPLANGVIARDTFEAKFAESICILNLGVADDLACF